MLARTQVLTFHGIGAPKLAIGAAEERYFVAEDIYRRTIAGLAGHERRHGVRIDITFDDGNLSDLEVGLPALAEAGRVGRFFVLAGRIGASGYLGKADVRRLHEAGQIIGSHGRDHVDWRRLDAEGARRELEDARKTIEDVVGAPVSEAAIPFGAFDRTVLHRLKSAGYRRIYTSTSGLSYDGAWFCPRWSVTDAFDPDRDLPQRLTAREKLRSSLFALARRARYRI